MKETFGSDMHGEIQEDLNWFERLARKFPGFKGYLEARDRREADQLLREALASRLENVRLQLGSIQQDLSGDIVKSIDFAEPIGRIDNRIMGLIGKIKDAPQGYSGFFDAVKIDTEDLDRIYQFDDNMALHIDSIAAHVDALGKAVREDGDIMAAVRTLDQAVQAANLTFNSRQEMLAGTA